MADMIYSKCGMRCDLCLIYRPNVEREDRRAEICKVFGKVWQGLDLDPEKTICDGCNAVDENVVRFSPDCEARKCVMDKSLEHCGHCADYPCVIFPAEPSQEVLRQRIDVEHQWTWEEEKLMEAYACKKNMDEFRRNIKGAGKNE